jgi:5-methylcytosine-specific restriction endonuclease McrA
MKSDLKAMDNRRYRPGKKKAGNKRSVEEILRDLKHGSKESGYREKSLRLHGHICAKCGREFDPRDLHLLTVHHRDGNPNNNPEDGSNWENLCSFCHEDEHSRGLLGDYLSGG